MGNENEREHNPAEIRQNQTGGGQSSGGETLSRCGESASGDDTDDDIGPGGQSEIGGASDLGGGETGLGSGFVPSQDEQSDASDFARDGEGALDEDQDGGSSGPT